MKQKGKRRMMESCLPVGLLERYALGDLSGGELDRVLDHLGECPLCARRFKILTRYFSGPAESYSGREPGLSGEVPAGIAAAAGEARKISPRPSGKPPVPAPGQVWLARPGERSASALFVLLPAVGGSPAVRGAFPAALLSWETGMAGEADLLVGEGESTLGLDFMVETWNRGYLPRERMERFLGKIQGRAEGALRDILLGRGPGAGAAVGPEICSLDDIRVIFQSREQRRAKAVGILPVSKTAKTSKKRREAIPPKAGRERAKKEKIKFAPLLSFAAAAMVSPGAFRKKKRKAGPEDLYNKYIRPFLPLAGALAVPLIAHFFFKKIARSLEKEEPARVRRPEPKLLLALSYCGLKKWDQALKVFASLLDTPAALFPGLIFSAWILSQTGKFRQAQEKIRQARQLPEKAKSFEIDFDRIERFIEEEREAEFREWFDRTIASCVLEDPARLLASR